MIVAIWVPKYNIAFDDPCCYPLGLMHISAVLRNADHMVVVLNNNLTPHNPEVLKYADCVLFTGFEEFMPENLLISAGLRKRGIHTVLGGACATFDTDNVKDHFDCVVTGEGEGAILSAITDFGVLEAAPLHMDDIPWADYPGFGIEEYHRRRDIRYMGVMASRGCPHHCTFCSATCKFRLRSLSGVKDEIEFYRDRYHIDTVVMNDNTLNCTPDRLSDFADMMRPLGLRWTAALRLDNMSDDVVKSAKDSGLAYTVVGVESFNQSKLDAMKKGISVEQIVTGLSLLKKYSIGYTGNILVDSVQEIDDNRFNIDRFGLYPTATMKFMGNNVESAPIEVINACREYCVSKGRTYAA